MTTLDLYVMEFLDLHVNRCKGKTSPHKAILLLSVIDLVEKGHYKDNLIYLDDVLVSTFAQTWAKYVSDNSHYKCNIANPYFHMEYEGFWQLLPYNVEDKSVFQSASTVGSLRKRFKCARIDMDLFNLLQHQESRAKLRTLLISTYL